MKCAADALPPYLNIICTSTHMDRYINYRFCTRIYFYMFIFFIQFFFLYPLQFILWVVLYSMILSMYKLLNMNKYIHLFCMLSSLLYIKLLNSESEEVKRGNTMKSRGDGNGQTDIADVAAKVVSFIYLAGNR